MPLLTINFEPGTTGTVTFENENYLFDTEGNEVAAPSIETMTVNSTSESIELRSGLDPDVTPNPWNYIVRFKLNGQYEFLAYLVMPMTDALLTDELLLPEPVTPEYFVLKSDLQGLGREVELDNDGTWINWRYVGDADWIPLVLLADLQGEAGQDGTDGADGTDGTDGEDGDPGPAIELQVSATHIQWRVVGAVSWINLIALAALKGDPGDDGTDGTDGVDGTDGADGREVELQTNATHIQWRLVGDPTWTDLIALLLLKGDPGDDGVDGTDGTDGTDGADGRNPEFQTSGTHIQWRLVGDPTWINLVALSAITGPPGADGTDGVDGADATAIYGDPVTIAHGGTGQTTAAAALTALGGAPLASPTFTGDPKAPTPTAGDNDTSVATTAFVTGAVGTETTARIADVDAEETRALAAEALLAPKASPALTGNPTAPTPTAGDNDTSIATTAFVTTAVAAEASARSSADSTLTTNLATKAPLNSPAFTGDPQVPTATTGDNDASIANTQFVTTAVGIETTARIADVDAEETRALAAEALLAPKASPALTGTPTAPTATSGTNTTQIATTAFVQTASGLLVPKSTVTTKGDLIIATGSGVVVRHGVGSDKTFLVADSSQTDGWINRLLTYADMWQLPRWTVAAGAQSIATGSTGAILGGSSTESVDTHGFHSNVTNPERITIPTGLGGTYLSMPKVSWASSTGVGIRRINHDINLGTDTNTVYVLPAAASSAMNFGLTAILTLADGDIVRVEGVHTQGANVSATMNEWTGIRIGP